MINNPKTTQPICFQCKITIGIQDDHGQTVRNGPQILMVIQNGDKFEFCSPLCILSYYAIAAHYETKPYGTDFSFGLK